MHGGQTLDGAIIAVNFERDGSCFTRVTLSNILHVLTRSNNRYIVPNRKTRSHIKKKLVATNPYYSSFYFGTVIICTINLHALRMIILCDKIIHQVLGRRIFFYPSLYLSASKIIEKN